MTVRSIASAAAALVLAALAGAAAASPPFADAAAGGPVPMSAFARPASAAAPTQRFEGRLVLAADQPAGGFTVLHNAFNVVIDAPMRSLPAIDAAFVQDGEAIIPVQRGPIAGSHPDWEMVVEPGLAWDDPGEPGFSRASVPFALRRRNADCLHNGVLSFAFRSDGAVSRVRYQISSETCADFKFDAWGEAAARYAPGAVDGAAGVIAAYRQEAAARLPVRPLSELVAAHPGVSAAGFALAAPADGDPPTLYGVVIDGVNYAGGCETRAGPYPFCDVLDLPSYSTAKSVFAAVALMRLEQLWPGARSALIADHVPQCDTPDWKGVTFEDALDMTTGVYGDTGFEADENAAGTAAFFLAERHADKIAFACGHYRRRVAPGAVWVYHTTDAYILGAAMQDFVRRKLGPDKDLYRDILAEPLWRPLRLSPVVMETRRTYDAARQPLTGYGLIYHRDDVARIAAFLMDAGRIDGRPMLDPSMLRRAMQADPQHRGPQAGYPNYVYADGVWGRDLAPLLNCRAPAWAPFMSGYGGISIAMLPNGIVYYHFGDARAWDWGPAAVEINKIRLLCP